MTVRIVTDSSAGLPAQLVKELGISVIPALICFGSETYRDGIDLTTEQFYKKLVSSKILPTTAVPAPTVFSRGL